MNKQEAVYEYVDHIIGNLYDLSKEDLMEAWCDLYEWNWCNKLGKRPVEWKSLKKRKHSVMDYIKHRITKSDFTVPIIEKIEDMVGRKALLRYWNVKQNEMTEEEFDRLWNSELKEIEYHMVEEDLER